MKLTISIDMGAKNNGVFIVKSENEKIIDKKGFNVILDKNSINFSKKSRRENRHRVRNYSRRKLAKKLLWSFLEKENFDNVQIELINGLLNNRGYTFLTTSSEFEELQDDTIEFLNKYIKKLDNLKTKEDFEAKISEYNLEELELFVNDINQLLDENLKKKKNEFDNDFRDNHSIIKKDLKVIKDFFNDVLKEIKTGSKPRNKYLQEIKDEINSYDFIENKEEFFNLIGNISNLQLRILRKFFDGVKREKNDYKLLKDYFQMFHWNYNDKEKIQKQKLFEKFNEYNSLEEFLYKCNPILTIPPYEDMNNRATYKCNSLLINPKVITDSLKTSIDILASQEEFEILKLENLDYPQKIQRILDINSKLIDKNIYPRNVFKYQKDNSNIAYYRNILENFKEFSEFAKKYYELEEKAINGIHKNGFFVKCNKNTPTKNNFKHILLKPLYEYSFKEDEVEKFIEKIKNIKGLQTHLKRISDTAKEYQNGFYHYIMACFENEKCLNDKNIQSIVKNLDTDVKNIKSILKELNLNTYLNSIDQIDKTNLKRILNILKQTYEILFKDINGFNKTCKTCTIENNFRSQGVAKRLLSDVAKPIDGMLDMMLDRIAFEIVDKIDECDEVEIILEQNRFLFEENLASIKSKKLKKREFKDLLNLSICPYTGENISDTNGEYDHILPQSKEVFNSKANLIYCSANGNRKKLNNRYYLKDLNEKHLKEIFKTTDIEKIQKQIKEGLDSIEKFTNFENLSLKEKISLRYALFLDENTQEFKKAFNFIKQDKLKTITNGTQKRLARLIYEKLNQKLNKDIKCDVKVIDNFLISATRKYLAFEMLEYDKETGEVLFDISKPNIQDSHSHVIDAMIAFYLANSYIKGSYHQKKSNLNSLKVKYDFKDIFIKESAIINVEKKQTFINAKDISAYKLFQDTIYKENYFNIKADFKNIGVLIKYSLLYRNMNNKKIYILDKNELDNNSVYKIDVDKTSNLLFELFSKKDKNRLKELKFLDKLRFVTSRADIFKIFFDEKQTKLLDFNKIKNIPKDKEKTFKAIYKILNSSEIFEIKDDKKILNKDKVYELLKNLFKLQKRKRGKKRHIFSLPILGAAQYRVRRGETIQVVAGENIATKSYIVDEKITTIPYFSKNVISLKIEDIIKSLDLDKATFIYDIEIDTSEINELNYLKYILTEKSRLSVIVEFNKNNINFNFDDIKYFDGSKDEKFKEFIENYINSEKLKPYIGSIRNNLKGKAILIDNNAKYIKLKYKADTTTSKKDLILKNYETYNNK